MEKLKKSVINLYGLPSFGFQLFITIEVLFFAAFLTDAIKMPVALAGTVLLVTSIFDIIWVPTSGIILEKTNMKWGKYRSWFFIPPIITAVFFTLQYTQIGSMVTTAIIISISFIVGHILLTTHYAAHIAMNNALTTVRDERIALSGNRGMWNNFGSLVFALLIVKMIPAMSKAVNNVILGHTYVVMIVCAIMVLTYLIFFAITKDYAHRGTETQNTAANKLTVGEMLKQIAINPPLIGLLLVELGRYLGRFIIFGMAFYYFKYVINDLAGLSLFITGLTVSSFFSAIIATPIAKKFGAKNTYATSIFILVLGLLAVWAIPMEATAFKVVMFIAYIGYGLPDTLGVALYSATVDYGEWKTGKNARGFIMSLIGLPIKTAVFIRSIIITAVLASVSYVADMAPTPELIQGIKNGFALYPAIIIILGALMLIKLFTITPKKLDEMNKEIAERKLVS